MKKFYTFALSAIVAVSSAFAGDIVKSHSADISKLGEPVSWEVMSKRLSGGVAAVNNMPAKPISRVAAAGAGAPAVKVVATPATAKDLVDKSWEGSYTDMQESKQYAGDASFEYYEEGENSELDLFLPGNEIGLYVGYENGKLIFYRGVNYGTNANGGIIMCPLDIETGAMLTSADVEVPFDEEKGEFVFPDDFVVGVCAVDLQTGNLKGYYWAGAYISLKAMAGDYKLDLVLEDECTPDNKFKISVSTGKDVASTKMLLIGYDADPDKHMQYMGNMGVEIKAGDITLDPVNKHALVEAVGPMNASDHATVIVATYDADGNVQRVKSEKMIVVLDDEKEWRSVGKMQYVDGLFSQYYRNFSHTQEVELQEQVDAPGVYRLINPYSAYTGSQSQVSLEHNADCHHYFVIDTTDPEWVSVPFSVSGLDLSGDGILTFGTCTALGYDKKSALERNLPAVTMEGQKITFPIKSVFCHEQHYNKPGSWSYMNAKSAVEITLPDIKLDFKVIDSKDMPIEGALVKMGSDAKEYVTDANGSVSVTVPFETGYFGKINMKVRKADSDEANVDVDLKGTQTAYTYKYDEGAGVDDVTVDGEGAAEYYNLQGVRVDNPAAGNIYIVKQGSKVSKRIIR